MSHYFSLATLRARPRDSDLLRRLSRHQEAYRDHALVWRLFPGDGLPRDFVFRQQVRDVGSLAYYIVSRREPRDVEGLFEVASKPYSPMLEKGALVRFDLRANPTVSRRGDDGISRRHDVLMDAKRRASPQAAAAEMEKAARGWLIARAVRMGLNVQMESLFQSAYRQHRLTPRGKQIEFSSIDYRGYARVVDPDALRRALLEGVGHARGFGCGLLLVKRMA